MYYILDLTQNPPTIIPDLSFQLEDEACEWISINGNATMYTIVKE
jgi:hypothetical protein